MHEADPATLGLSVEDAARIAGIGRSRIYEELKEGRLTARKVGKRTLILRTDLEAWLNGLPTMAVKAGDGAAAA